MEWIKGVLIIAGCLIALLFLAGILTDKKSKDEQANKKDKGNLSGR